MNWIQSLSKAIKHIEAHLTDEIDLDEVAGKVFSPALDQHHNTGGL